MRKKLIYKTIEEAVQDTNTLYDDFQGVILFGSFVTKKRNPNDLDMIPVLNKYDGCWNFTPLYEGEPVYDEDYYRYKEMINHFGTYFKDHAENHDAVFRTARIDKGLIHIESIVALDDMKRMKESLKYYNADPNNFVGTEKAYKKIYNYFLSKKIA